ncbi:MAG: DinB family protein [Crocinitomicaceae bacterium]|nr:DinB family protein [Crocinitomicaceae bacterium]
MRLSSHLKREFSARVFEEFYPRVYKCLSLIDDDKLWESPNENIPSIGSQVLHICGNARQWILAGVAGHDDIRKRDEEFLVHKNIRKSELIFLLENLKVNLKVFMEGLRDIQVVKFYTIQGYRVNGFSAIIHVIEHFSYHVGQMTLLTKLYSNENTNYYGELDLNDKNRLN